MPADVDVIAALVYRYAELLDSGDLDGVAALFARATWRGQREGRELRGVAQVRRAYEPVVLYDGRPRTRHVITNLTVDVAPGGDDASASSYFTVFQALPDFPLQPIIAGSYRDRFAHDAEGWYFTERVIEPDLVGDLTRHYSRPLPE